MPQSFDGRLNYRRWDEEPEVWSYAGPFASFMEQQVQQALSVAHMTADEVTTYVRAPLPQVAVFRPRTGYPPVQERQARVQDIVNAPRRMDARATWYSGGPAGMLGGSRFMSNNLGLT
jgi:hypothetical protein